jgi:hypothetical protein
LIAADAKTHQLTKLGQKICGLLGVVADEIFPKRLETFQANNPDKEIA